MVGLQAQSAPAASCTTEEHSSGTGRSSSSSREHQKPAEGDAEGASERQRSSTAAQAVLPQVGSAGTTSAAVADEGPASTGAAAAEQKQSGKAPRGAKIPKLPMVQYGKKWYRAKVLKDVPGKVLVEFQGYSHEGGPFWLAKESSRLWKGSYKGRDWKHLVSDRALAKIESLNVIIRIACLWIFCRLSLLLALVGLRMGSSAGKQDKMRWVSPMVSY